MSKRKIQYEWDVEMTIVNSTDEDGWVDYGDIVDHDFDHECPSSSSWSEGSKGKRSRDINEDGEEVAYILCLIKYVCEVHVAYDPNRRGEEDWEELHRTYAYVGRKEDGDGLPIRFQDGTKVPKYLHKQFLKQT